jgi:hypothetical protein
MSPTHPVNTTSANNNVGLSKGGSSILSGGGPYETTQSSTASTLNQLKKVKELIVIHVFDENRKVNKDFSCEKDLLVNHMKYFEKYLTEATSVDDIDISVHCDIKIFEWLMKYLKKKDQDCLMDPTQIKDENFPKLDIKNVISILISSDFLQMMILVDECIDFVVKNLHDVVRLPIDMNCLSSNLIKRISDKVPIDKLDELVDKRDKLTSKLFMKKLQALISSNSEGNSSSSFLLNRCIYCGQLYTGE